METDSRKGPAGRVIARALCGTALALLVPALTIATPAASFELFGYRFFEDEEPDEAPSPDAQTYSIDVAVSGLDDDTAERIRGASRLFAEREETPPPSTAAFLSRANADYARIVGALYAEGRYGGSVTMTVNGRDPATIDPFTPLPPDAKVEVTVDAGPPFRFGKVDLPGRAPRTSDPEDQPKQTLEGIGLEPGLAARSGAVIAAERLLVDEWHEQGYPKARIADRDAVADHPSQTLDVSILTESGPPATFGPINVTGAAAMDPDFVVWMTGIKPGQAYDPDAIRKAERNLRRLQVFSSTRFVEGEKVGADGMLPMTLNVAERLPRVFGAGATYSTVDGAGVEGYWEHRNLFGRAEKLRFDARIGGVDSVDPGDFNYYLGSTFTKPGVITPLTDLTALVSAERNDFETYEEATIRARIGLAHEFFEGLSGTTAINIEASEITDAFDTRRFYLVSLPSDITWDTRDEPLDATEGWRTKLSIEPFNEFNYGNVGLITDLEGSTYVSLASDDRIVLALRGAVGSIVGAPQREIPESRLFFAGGGGSVRGYAYRNIGPRENGEIVGGRSYVEASAEVRVRINESFGVVPFVDAGSAFASELPDFSEDIKVGAGIGIRYYTGLGPIRADIAVPLNPGKDDPAVAFYLGLGQSF